MITLEEAMEQFNKVEAEYATKRSEEPAFPNRLYVMQPTDVPDVDHIFTGVACKDDLMEDYNETVAVYQLVRTGKVVMKPAIE